MPDAPEESPKARRAWTDYLALGPDRSLEKLLNQYQTNTRAPTKNITTLKTWSRRYGWQARLQEIADREVREAEAREAAHRREILETGYALPHERVALLKRLIDPIVEDLTGEKRWLKDAKWIGSGEDGEKIELERFNSAGYEALRGLLDDIAKEKGERVKAVKVDIEPRLRALAERYGLDPDETVAEAHQALLRSRSQGEG